MARGRTAEIYAWGEGRVLKLFLPGFEGGAQYEFDVARAVTANGVPAPLAFDLITVSERPGIVYARVDGEPVARRLSRRPWQVSTMGRLMADVQAAIHRASASAEGLPSQHERLARRIEQAPALHDAEKRQVLERLSVLPDAHQVCHGDFHPENVLLTAGGPQVIDWTDAALGHPHADVARTSLLLRTSSSAANLPPLMRPLLGLALHLFHEAYLNRYLAVNRASRADVEAWEVVCAAARLRENIPGSETVLLRLIRARLA